MERRMRIVFSIAILAVAVGWIVLSYLPTAADNLPKFQYSPNGLAQVFPAIIIGGFLMFVALQVWIVRTTAASVRRYEAGITEGSVPAFRLSARKETILTALPIVFSVLLAIAARGWWQHLLAMN